MNIRYDFKTDGAYLHQSPDHSSLEVIRLFMEDAQNDHANNYLLLGTLDGNVDQALTQIKEGLNGQTTMIPFHIDDNDSSEIYWYTEDEWHYIITPYNEGDSLLLTRTHPDHEMENIEYKFYPFS